MLTEIFVDVDDFCNIFVEEWSKRLLPEKSGKSFASCLMSLSEIMTITVYFHLSNYRTFKHYYKDYVCKYLTKEFPKLLSYNRFVEVMKNTSVPLLAFLKYFKSGKCTSISFVDSTKLVVCDNHRINQHKVFKGLAQRGKSSMGWFFGFKLHLVVNELGDIINFSFTPGNVDDRNRDVFQDLTKNLLGKLFGDKGYISKDLNEILKEKNIELITKPKKNMKARILPLIDKILLRKRAVIETVNDELKNICQIEHSRHRSFDNFLTNLFSGLIAYSFKPHKPSINFSKKDLELLGNLPAMAF